MLILLPPSEGKRALTRGRPLELESLSYPELTTAREHVLDNLIAASASPDAAADLKFGASLADQVAANTALRAAPTAPAASVYTGVLYEAAGLGALTGVARRRANSAIRIISALWGVVSAADRIPGYRLSMTSPLTPVAPLASYWSSHLSGVLQPTGAGVVLDCRSAAYRAAWSPDPDAAWLAVRVLTERDGRSTVVSHHAKHTRGLLVGHLLTRQARMPRSSSQVIDAARELIGPVLADVRCLPSQRGPDTLDLVLA